MDDEDDPVVEEIPVFVTNTLANNLYLYQYPIKDSMTGLDRTNVVNCCAKPYNEQVKVDFAVVTNSKNYDAFKGDQFALGADANSKQSGNKCGVDRPTFPSGRMDKISFVSSKPSQNVNRFVIGVLLDKEVHCTPLKTILQLRPSFSYFDKKDVGDKVEQKAKRAEASDTEEEEPLKQITVKFQSNERWKKMQEQSYESYLARAAEEPWCETLWCPTNSTSSELERQKLLCAKSDVIYHTLGLNSSEYIKNLIPPERKEVSIDSIVPSKVVNFFQLRSLPLADQIKRVLMEAKIISFDKLVTILDDGSLLKDKVLQNLPTIGLLLRGNWMIQSEYRYPEKSFSAQNGVPAELMCRARDYIIYQFTKRFSISRHKMIEVTQLPCEEITEILGDIASLNDFSKEWELSENTDQLFISKNSDLVHRQELIWKSKEDLFTEMEQERPSISSIKRIRKRSIRESKATDKPSLITNSQLTNGS